MADKNLPIKFFAKRDKDELPVEGGGGKPPKWVLKGRELVARSRLHQRFLRQLETRMSVRRNETYVLPTVIKAKLNIDATAKSHRDAIVSLFNVGYKENVIGFSGFYELLLKVDNERDLRLIEENFKKANEVQTPLTIAKGISAIEELKDLTPEVKLDVEGEIVFKIKLINYHDNEINEKAKEIFEELCRQNGINIRPAGYLHDKNIYRAETSLDSINELLEFEGLFSIEDMPSVEVSLDMMEEEGVIELRKPDKSKTYPLVGVLDSGIERIEQINEWVVEEKETYYPDEYTNKNHGTGVTSILIHGDALQGSTYTGTDGCMVFEACVFPDKEKIGIREDELIQQIEDCIRKHGKKIKFWNVCVGTSEEAAFDTFSDFGKALDALQKELDVVIIKSVGNCENFKYSKPRGRISRSADSLMSIVVGAITHERIGHDLDEKHNPSPFTRTGPGPCHINKPDLVHIGGNAGMYAGRPVYNGVRCLDANGRLRKIPGTSFATPRVSALIAWLHHSLDVPFDPILLKGMLIHNAHYPAEMKMDMLDKIRLAGFGMPPALEEMLFNDPNEITLILRDRLDKGNYISILDFPFPQSLVDENGFYTGEVTVTLVADPILEANQQGGEYCQSNIDIVFGTYDQKKQRDTSKPTIKNEIGPDGGKSILSPGLYSKQLMKEDTSFKTDRLLVAYEKKYHPIKKWVLNLADLTDGNKEKIVKAPKLWYLTLKGSIRDYAEKKYQRLGITPSQKFCLLITIRDSKRKGTLYNDVTQLLNAYNFAQTDIRVDGTVRLRLNG